MSLEPDPLPSDSPPRSPRSPGFAAFLSFFIPGLGQAWAGQILRGALIALPVVALAGLVVAAAVGGPGIVDLAGIALQPAVLVAILVLDVILLGYRSWAIVDGYLVARRRSRSPGGGALGRVVVVALVAVTVASHGFVAYLGWNTFDLVSGVFGSSADGNGPAWGDDVEPSPALVAEATPAATPDALPASWPSPAIAASPGEVVDPDASASPSTPPSPATSSPTPTARADVPYWAKDGRLNILLLGGDAGPGRDSIRTDSMILLTVDLKTARAALASIPRNLLNVPLPAPYASKFKGGVFPDLLNALWRYANDRPGTFPGNNATRGFRAISATIGYITGTEIDALAYVDLNGFVRLIDALGGLRIDVPKAVYDAKYPNENGIGTRVLDIKPGFQRMDGSTALAYARTRHQDSDYGRISRQQLVLLALRKQINPCSLLPRLPDLVAIAKKSMYTNIPAAELPKLLALAARVDRSRIERIEFTPAKGYPEWVTQESVTKMRRAIRDAFKGDPPPPGGAPDLSLLSC
jgi:LCP family protein required for cell wall assembly